MHAFEKIFPADDFALLALILGLPLLGAFVNGVFGKRLGKDAVRLMALSALGASFLGSLLAFFLLQAAQGGEGGGEQAARFVWHGWQWMGLSRAGEASLIHSGAAPSLLQIEVAFSIDALSGTMALIVTGVGFLIHLYSSSYMDQDPGFHRFFAYLNLFIFSMLVLILGNSLPILFVGWEGVGLCSYLLIGFWFDHEANARAGKKAFIVNRIGDFGLLVAMALLIRYTGALDWDGMASGSRGLMTEIRVWDGQLFAAFLPSFLTEPRSVSAATLVGLSLFLGCAGKSAQIPLYVWLPDAMAGPTPVSALIHAATMVTAGIYLVCRMAGIFALSPAAMFVVACIGALTALFAASIALVQRDIKKVLAYSTVSQLGYMFLGVGVGAFTAGFFHVLTHAFFKACLFLGAGSVIHSMHARIHDTDASQDVNNMGGLKKYLPWTHLTFLVSVLAIAGLPLTSGFFSKDEILYSAYTRSVVSPNPNAFVWPAWTGALLFAIGVTTAVMTAFYMFRVYFLTFHGEFKGWKIVPGWQGAHDDHSAHGHDDHAHAAHDHGQSGHESHGHEHHASEQGDADHDHAAHGQGAHGHAAHSHAPAGPLEGPAPHESPWPMTLPLVILATLAAFGGFLNAHPLHIVPLEHWLEPVFASAVDPARLHTKDPDDALMIPLLIPGVLAFLVGSGLAYVVYLQRGGAPERSLAARFPGAYQLVFEKWRVDELYDELVVGSLEALAEASVWIDRWVVDGILARLTALLVTVWGHLLRLLQTGHAQAYAAVMVLGLFGLGWFVTVPQPQAAISGDAATGQYAVQAAPGLGYSYRWDADGDGNFDTDQFGAFGQVTLTLEEGASRDVQLQVKNAFGRVRSGTFSVSRPKHEGSVPLAGAEPRGLPSLPARALQRTTMPAGGVPRAGNVPAAVPGAGAPGGVQ
jgi:NADH-quinone oxidoreductase subunit L